MTGHGLFVGAAVFGVALIAITEGLSPVNRLTAGWLVASWGLAGGLGLWAIRRRRLAGSPAALTSPMPYGVRLVIGSILAVTGAIALLAPPNTWDSMTYHMPRVAHWSQAGSVAHYPTHVIRQLWLGPGAEFVITHLYVLTGGDRLANLVQWAAFAGCVFGSAIVAGELGGGPRARAVAAIAGATLPMAIAQASSTQNDLVASFWVLSLGYWVLRFRVTPSAGVAALAGVSAGLAVLTKLPVIFLAVPWLAALTVRAGRLGPRRALACVLAAAVSVLAPNLNHVGRTLPVLERVEPSSGPGVEAVQLRLPADWTLYVNTTLDPRALASNAFRNVALHLVTPSGRANAWLEGAVVGAHRAMGFNPSDSRTTFGPAFHVGPFRLHEDFVGNPLHLLAGFLAGVAVWRRRDSSAAPVRMWAWMTVAGAIAFCALRWQPWNSRLHLPLFILAAPLVGVGLERWRRSGAVLAAAFCLLALPSLAATRPRPLLGPDSVLSASRTAQRFRNHPQLQLVYEAAVDHLGDAGCGRVGLVMGGDGWEYPLWPLLRSRVGADLRIEHVLVRNPSGRLGPPAAGPPCAVLVLGQRLDAPVSWQGRTFVERWRRPPVSLYWPEP
jgi:hypothetical protein